jgi:Mrp family chromosome partitioning ATPase
MAQILQEAAETFDWVIIDSPPVGVLTDAKLLAAMADAALLVVAAGSTPCATLKRAAEALGPERLLGVVLNRIDERSASDGDYYKYHYYYGARGANGHRPGLLARLLGRR